MVLRITLLACFLASPSWAAKEKGPDCPSRVRQQGGTHPMLGDSAAMAAVRRLIARIAPTHLTVLITGETGTGKEVVAQSLVKQSGKEGPLVVVNMAAVPKELADSEFFGSEKGSYTGSDQRRIGHFESADGGTIFLDEIAEMPLGTQAKLLRVLDGYGFSRVGSSEVIRPQFRLIAATHANLAAMVRKKLFREDLYFRLYQTRIHLPPLRDRREDIAQLAQHFLDQNRLNNPSIGPAERFSAEAIEKLEKMDFTGNVRELSSVVVRAYLIAEKPEIQAEDIVVLQPLPGEHDHVDLVREIDEALADGDLESLQKAVQALERIRFEIALQKSASLRDAAAQLGITLPALRRMARQYEMDI